MLRWVTLVVLFVPLVYCHLYGMNEGCFGEIDPTNGNFTEISCLGLDLDFDFDDVEDHEHPTSSAADRVNGIYYIAARNPATVYGIHISNGSLYTTITYPDNVQNIQGLAYDPRSQKLIAQEVYTKSGSSTSDITITDAVTKVRKTLIKGKPFKRSCLTNPLCSVSASINSFGRKYFLPDTNNNAATNSKEQIFVVNLDHTEYSNIHLKNMGDMVEFSNVEWVPSISTFVSISTFESVEYSEYLDLITIDNDGEVMKESLFDKSEDFNHPLSATFNKDDNLYYVMTSTPDLTNFHLYSIDIETWNATVVSLETDTKVHFIQHFPETPEDVVVDDDTVGDGVSFESEEESSAVSESGDGDDDGSTFITSSSDSHSGLFALLIILLIAVVVIVIVAAGILFFAWRKGVIGNRVEMV